MQGNLSLFLLLPRVPSPATCHALIVCLMTAASLQVGSVVTHGGLTLDSIYPCSLLKLEI